MFITHFLLGCMIAFSALCVIFVLFFERKNPSSSLLWILILLVFPVGGFICYLFIGSGFRISRKKRYKLKAISDDIYDNYIVKHLNIGRSRVYLNEHAKDSRLLTYLRNEGEGVFTDDNSVEIFTDGNFLFPRLLEDVRNAASHIHLLFYIFRNDSLGRELIAILTEKATQGVEVRVMYDSIGSLMVSDKMFRDLKKAGGKVMPFAPLFSSLNSHLRLNYRNHRKIAVIDGLVGYVGGMNIGDEYRGCHKRCKPWRDTHLRITGSAVWFLQERFFMDWGYASEKDVPKADISRFFPQPLEIGRTPMQIVASGPDTAESPIKSGMLSMIYSAEKNIYLQTPYFAPDESFYDALRIAARSNVDVRLMAPRIGDNRVVQWATLGYLRDAQDVGVKIYEFDGFIHSKTMVVDGAVATIGTTNITNRSFTLDFEVNAFIYDKAFAKVCEEIFHCDEKKCQLLPDNYFCSQSMFVRAGYNLARLLAPMI